MRVGELGNRIKARRAEQGMTQAQLAEAIGVTRKTVNTVENRIFVPSAILALKMAEALEAPVEELFFLEKNSGACGD